ncbi:hypothetical protein CB0940_08518 [Cercospora beticola]|uniref:Uncharacterized protein n=1 Tax=Cercospora beticola TaxID=122368 RepID=A0A2G5HQV8_CERBT|nr:hypothetical protein CB0940_08518 [Cercospora beticola]PIA94908.1 hypothetical protein CB0940_08518 [Cercospora beticola]WPB05095.1 hypothetical protein RHO25_009745 [Cercospora beticola]
MISAPLELTQAVKPADTAKVLVKQKSLKSPPPASCKPQLLSPTQKPTRPLVESPSADRRHSLELIRNMCLEIDSFLNDVKDHGYVLHADESKIADRLEELEHHEHILSPIAETPEVPGGFNPLTLTYSLPKANLATKPYMSVSLAERKLELPVKNPARERPTNVWRNLGSRKYLFVDEGRVVPQWYTPSPPCLPFLSTSTSALHGSMAANDAVKEAPSAYGLPSPYNPQGTNMAGIATATAVNTVSMWPVTTIGTSTSYVPIPTNCWVVGMETKCVPNPPPPPAAVASTPAPAIETTTATAVLTLTSHGTTKPSATGTSSGSEASSTQSMNPSSITPSSTTPPLPGFTGTPDEGDSSARSRQIGVALGISFALLLAFLLIWAFFAWKNKLWPFRKPDASNEEAAFPMEKIDRNNDAHLTGGAAVFPRRKSLRPQSQSSSTRIRPPSSTYSQDLNLEKRNEAPYEAWTDTMSNASRNQPQATRDFIDGRGSGIEDQSPTSGHRPFSGSSFASLYDPMPPTPPPTSPLPPIPLAAALRQPLTERQRRSMIYRSNFPDSPVIAQERGFDQGPYQNGILNNDAMESHWSLQRMGTPSPVDGPFDEDMKVPGSPLDRVTGFEYLYSMPKHRDSRA